VALIGLRSARICSLRSAKLGLAYARPNFAGRGPLGASFCFQTNVQNTPGPPAVGRFSLESVFIKLELQEI